jgi:hypothetical protein
MASCRLSALVVFHRGHKLRQVDGGIRNPVAVVAAVKGHLGPEDREIERDDAARAKGEGRTAARMNRAIEYEQ